MQVPAHETDRLIIRHPFKQPIRREEEETVGGWVEAVGGNGRLRRDIREMVSSGRGGRGGWVGGWREIGMG